MAHKLVNREILNIVGSYLYNKPLLTSEGRPQNNTTRHIHRPLDLFMRSYFNSRKYLGGSERSVISDKVYNLVRHEYLLSHLIRSKPFDIEQIYAYSEQIEKEI